ncbi:CsbD family protein [Mycolicibacterium hodleri]|uniref:CsbD family protein n=1 Tax=Mycolicibacterium hodleri TaxID=49897 RepID=A0A502E945_9MYCO|nr:CsbD family protein [Mycolicibacterium hodleri]TPG33036.1 CsbD family protein [Mycolicibacterium hodleri]
MGIVDKAKNAAEDAVGKAKEVIGDVTGNEDLEAEGKKDQGVSGAKKIGEDVKDVFEK